MIRTFKLRDGIVECPEAVMEIIPALQSEKKYIERPEFSAAVFAKIIDFATSGEIPAPKSEEDLKTIIRATSSCVVLNYTEGLKAFIGAIKKSINNEDLF